MTWPTLPGAVVYGAYAALLLSAWALWRREHPRAVVQNRRVLAYCVGTATLLFVISEPQAYPFQDFLDAYYAGGRAALGGPEAIQEAFSRGVHGFVNLPILGFIFVPFAVLPPPVASTAFLLLGTAAVVWAWHVVGGILELGARERALLAVLFALNGPIFNSLKEGNTSHFALLALALSWQWLRRGQSGRAGGILASAALLKLPLLLFGPFLALRGFLKGALSALTVLAVTGLLSIAVFGIEIHSTWYDRFVASAGRQPIAAFNVQSPTAALLRFSHGGQVSCRWEGVDANRKVRVLAAMAGGGALLLPLTSAWLTRRRTSSVASQVRLDVEFTSLVLLAGILSPLSWSHYYSWALLPVALLLKHRSQQPGIDRVLLMAATALVSLPVVWPRCDVQSWLAGPYLLFLSHFLLGAGLLLILLFRHSLREPVAIGPTTSTTSPTPEPFPSRGHDVP